MIRTRLITSSILFVSLLTFAGAGTARADDYELCRDSWWGAGRCWNRDYRRPRWRPVPTVAIEGGASHFNEGGPGSFTSGFGNATEAGGVWGVRVGLDFFSWLGIEARYLGMYNGVHSNVPVPSNNLYYVTTAGMFDVRLAAPIPYIHPYIFAGIGVYNVKLHGPGAQQELSILQSSTQAGIPMGVGIDVPLNWHVSFAVEAAYHFQLNESFAKTTVGDYDGGDFSTVTGLFRVRI